MTTPSSAEEIEIIIHGKCFCARERHTMTEAELEAYLKQLRTEGYQDAQPHKITIHLAHTITKIEVLRK